MMWKERASFIFIGLLYISAGVAVIVWPSFLYYVVAAIFAAQGVFSFIRAIVGKPGDS